jgi:heme-degrading monooxygenase HmoA
VTVYARVLTFTGVDDVDAAVTLIQEMALPVVRAQRGYKGLSLAADRSGRILGSLSLWESEADRDASDSALAKTREDARAQLGASGLTVETFEEMALETSRPPAVGCALMVTRVSMDPGKVDENVEYFKREVAPQIKAAPGFRALRNMFNRQTGEGAVGVVWDDEAAMEAAAKMAMERRPQGEARGVNFVDTSYLEIVLIDGM